MKQVFLLGWACFALMFTSFMPAANAQEKSKKEEKRIVIIGNDTIINGNVTKIPGLRSTPNNDSILTAMKKLNENMAGLNSQLKLYESDAAKNNKDFPKKELKALQEEMTNLRVSMDYLRSQHGIFNAQEFEDRLEEEIELAMEEEAEEEDNSKKDTSKYKKVTIDESGIHIRTGKNKRPKNVVKEPKNSATDWLLFDLGINTFIHNNSFELPESAEPLELDLSNSINSTLHIFKTGVNIYRHKLYTTFGLTYDMHDYRFEKNTTLLADTNRFAYIESPFKLEKNKLSAQYITLPLMLHFESNPYRPSQSFKIGFGGWGGFLVNSYTKQKSETRGKQHLHDNFNLNILNYGVRAQIGYGMFTLYSQYALSPLFKSNAAAPELNPITFGITLSGFKWN